MAEAMIIGAGPAGLTAAWELARLGHGARVFEQDNQVGGIARTCEYKGYRFDIGGHRFFTKVPYIQALWREMLAEDFLVRPRLSRIYYDGRFFDYPLKPVNAIFGLGAAESLRIGASYTWSRLFPVSDERNFEDWVSNRFGRRLYEIFFKTYTEKVWGMDCREISADWAAQRIKNLDLITTLRNALLGSGSRGDEIVTTLIERFHYPRYGPGQIWESAARKLEEKGITTHLGERAIAIHHRDGRVRSIFVNGAQGEREIEGEHFLSSMPIRTLLHSMDPLPPASVLAAADRLRYRDFLTVILIVDKSDLFPDNWIYIHEPKVKLGRVQNFKNWSPYMVPDPNMTSLGLEYFVHESDELWCSRDEALVELGKRECAQLGLVRSADVIDGAVVRMPKAYPVYDDKYQQALLEIRAWLEMQASNLQLIGRNGLHRYNNQDHSMLTAVYAARNIAAGTRLHDVWGVNVDTGYDEEVRGDESVAASGTRTVPGRSAALDLVELMREAFGRYDPVALGIAVGVLSGIGLFLATAVLLLRGGSVAGSNLSLLGNYLLGYEATWSGAFLGLVEATLAGFAVGWLLGTLANWLITVEEQRVLLRLGVAETLLKGVTVDGQSR